MTKFNVGETVYHNDDEFTVKQPFPIRGMQSTHNWYELENRNGAIAYFKEDELLSAVDYLTNQLSNINAGSVTSVNGILAGQIPTSYYINNPFLNAFKAMEDPHKGNYHTPKLPEVKCVCGAKFVKDSRHEKYCDIKN